jgi:MFS family permease
MNLEKAEQPAGVQDPAKKWRTVLLLSFAVLLAMGLWFSASAVTPTLADVWNLNGGQVAWLTMAVTVGFVAGAFLSALTNVSDLYRPRLVFAVSAFIGAAATALITISGGFGWLVTLVALVWGFAIAPDSGQYSTAVSELCAPEYTGTALTLQTSMGFLLTLVTVRLVPTLVAAAGWQWAFAFLALGPLFGIWAMRRLGRSPEAAKLAGGRG